ANAQESPRLKAHHQAQQELLQTHFYYQGRGMHMSPDIIKLYDWIKESRQESLELNFIHQTQSLQDLMLRRWGFNLVDSKIIGLFSVDYKDLKVGVLGCVACHSGRAAGQFIVGLGNKTIDAGQTGADLELMQKAY